MSAYATLDQLAEYLGDDTPANGERWLQRATDIVRWRTGSAVEIPASPEAIPVGATETDEERRQIACRNATMALVEEWIWQGSEKPQEARGAVKSESIGKTSFTYEGGGLVTAGQLPSRVIMYLEEAGLLYAGAELSAGEPPALTYW